MLRITELRLPLNHAEGALRPAAMARLGVGDADLRAFTVFKRAYDARKKTAIQLIYTLDCELADEAAVLARFATDPHIRPAPDTRYRFVGHAPMDFHTEHRPRPVVLVPGTTGPERSAALAGARKTRPVVVAIERAGLDDVVSVRRALRSAQPDLVIALIDARDRLEDITRWIESFDRVDAIALDCALEVADPAAALHLDLPVIRMDGIPVDRFGWAALLCAQLETLDCVR